jgi:NDP-sugar pyrophosphorylase family protein
MGSEILKDVLEIFKTMTPKQYAKLYKETQKEYGEFFEGLDKAEKKRTKKVRQNSLKYIVRLYDGFDNHWIDISKPVSLKEANKIWNDRTKNGTEKTQYGDIDYFKVFPADTKMLR